MPRKANMTVDGMVDYLLNDLKQSVKNDVYPCLQTGSRTGGYFVVPRLVLSYVDYLGALHNGYTGRTNSWGRRIFADASYAKKFLRDFFGKIDQNYFNHGDLLWEIYRNGTIHLYEPLTLENDGKTISWQIFKGGSGERTIIAPIGAGGAMIPLPHVVPWPVQPPTVWVLPVSTTCLYEDLLVSIDKFAQLVRTDSTAQGKFRSTMDALVVPEQTSQTWP